MILPLAENCNLNGHYCNKIFKTIQYSSCRCNDLSIAQNSCKYPHNLFMPNSLQLRRVFALSAIKLPRVSNLELPPYEKDHIYVKFIHNQSLSHRLLEVIKNHALIIHSWLTETFTRTCALSNFVSKLEPRLRWDKSTNAWLSKFPAACQMIQSRGRPFRGPLIKVSNWGLLKHKDGYKFGTRSDEAHVRMNIFIVLASRVYSWSGFHVLWHTLYFLSFSFNILNLLRVLRKLAFIVALTAQTRKINKTTRSNHLLRTFV